MTAPHPTALQARIAEHRALLAGATPAPWTIVPDCYGGKEEAWCEWHKAGPLTLDGGEPDADTNLIVAARNNYAAALDVVEAAALVSQEFEDRLGLVSADAMVALDAALARFTEGGAP